MSAEDYYKAARRQVRELALRDSLEVAWAYSQFLAIPEFDFPNGIQVHRQFLEDPMPQITLPEWIIEQIAREVIRYADLVAPRGRTLRNWDTLALIAKTLKDLDNELYKELAGGRIMLHMLRIAHQQFVWQHQPVNWRWVVRYYKLFNDAIIRGIILERLGLILEDILQIGLGYLATYATVGIVSYERSLELLGVDRAIVDAFLQFTSLRRNALVELLRREHALDETYGYKFSSMRAYPIVEISHRGVRELACPVPTLLFWRITAGLYYEIRDHREFSNAFGASFQSLIGEMLRLRMTRDGFEVIEEAQYHVGRNREDTVDWIVRDDDSALFVECKTKRLRWSSKAGLTDLYYLDEDIATLAKAVVQVYRTIRDYRGGLYPTLAYEPDRSLYVTVVTLEDWFLFGPGLPGRLDGAVRQEMVARDLPLEWLTDMPYSVASLDDVDMVMGVVNGVGIRKFFTERQADPERPRWAFRSHCYESYREIVEELPRLFRDEYDALFGALM